MSLNHFGKALVLVHSAASLLFMTFAAAIFFQQMDWGWLEPRKDMTGTVRLPAEIDQRHAAVVEAQRTIELVLPALRAAQANLIEASPRISTNHRWYHEQLARLQNDAKPLKIQEIKVEGGRVVLDTPGKDIGKPVLGKEIPGLEKSIVAYGADLMAVQKEIDDTVDAIRKLIEDKEMPLTVQLNGKDDAGKKVRPGLYDLVEGEYQDQVRTKFEIEYLQPQWVEVLRQVGQFQERRQLMAETVARLKKARAGTKK